MAWFSKSSVELNRLDSLGSREETAIHCIDDGLGADLSTAKESAVEAFDGILASLDAVELEIDIALRVGI